MPVPLLLSASEASRKRSRKSCQSECQGPVQSIKSSGAGFGPFQDVFFYVIMEMYEPMFKNRLNTILVMVDLDVPERVGKWLVAFLNCILSRFITVYPPTKR